VGAPPSRPVPTFFRAPKRQSSLVGAPDRLRRRSDFLAGRLHRRRGWDETSGLVSGGRLLLTARSHLLPRSQAALQRHSRLAVAPDRLRRRSVFLAGRPHRRRARRSRPTLAPHRRLRALENNAFEDKNESGWLVWGRSMLYSKKWPGRLPHHIPHWVDPSQSIYHIRNRVHGATPCPLTDPHLARRLLDSVVFFGSHQRWWPHVFLLMPDHLHALLSFPATESMSRVIADWKRWHTKTNRVAWQEGFFDHRLRREESLEHAIEYIRKNPVARGLCTTIDDWPWRLSAQDMLKARKTDEL